jgi:hypothetical protein
MSNEEKNENINIDVDEIMKQITDFSEKLHMKNRQRIKNGIICMLVIPLIFLIVLFAADSSKVVYLLLWVISLFIIAIYLITVAYIDYTMQENLGLKIKNGNTALIGDELEGIIDAVKNRRPIFMDNDDEDEDDDDENEDSDEDFMG